MCTFVPFGSIRRTERVWLFRFPAGQDNARSERRGRLSGGYVLPPMPVPDRPGSLDTGTHSVEPMARAYVSEKMNRSVWSPAILSIQRIGGREC